MKYIYPFETPCGDELEAHTLYQDEFVGHELAADAEDFSFCVKNHFKDPTYELNELNASLIAERIYNALVTARTKRYIDKVVNQHNAVYRDLIMSLSRLGEYEEQRALFKDFESCTNGIVDLNTNVQHLTSSILHTYWRTHA